MEHFLNNLLVALTAATMKFLAQEPIMIVACVVGLFAGCALLYIMFECGHLLCARAQAFEAQRAKVDAEARKLRSEAQEIWLKNTEVQLAKLSEKTREAIGEQAYLIGAAPAYYALETSSKLLRSVARMAALRNRYTEYFLGIWRNIVAGLNRKQ
jgi:hypothetical protein